VHLYAVLLPYLQFWKDQTGW